MKSLFATAYKNPKNRFLLAVIICAICFATVASQLEIFAIGLITQRGPDAFELFAPMKEGKLVPTDQIERDSVEARWSEVASGSDAPITKKEAAEFVTAHKAGDWMNKAFFTVDQYFGIRKDFVRLALFLAIVAIFKALTMFMHRFSTKLMSISISRDLRQQYFEHIQKLPMTFYQKYNMGSLSSRVVGDAALIADALNACLVNYLQTPFVVLSTLILCFLTSWELSLFIFLGFPLLLFPITFLSRGVKRVSKQIQATQEKFAAHLLDFLGGIQTIKVFAMEEFSLSKYREHNQKMADLEKKSARYDLSARPIVHTIAMLFLSIALVYGLYVLNMEVSAVLFFCGMLYLFYEPIKKFAEENTHIQRGVAAAERLLEVMEQKPTVIDLPNAKHISSFSEDIVFKEVSFKYGTEWILRDLSFQVKKGQKVALVGPTGAGKSTIAQLLPRLYDLEKGTISIDGKPLTTYTQHSLREMIAFVPQRPFLFMDTIAANIAYGRPYSMAEIEKAAKRAHAAEFIEQLPDKYLTFVQEGGKNLSGGQQQRLAIARALVKKAPLLIMDEATSSLDAVSEEYIKQALNQIKGDVTQLVIAHRLSTIEDADLIIYLEQGMKVDEGTKDELLKRCEPFKRMWELMHKKQITM